MYNETDDLRKIYEDFYPKIVGYLRRLVGDHDAEDVTQEVFLKVNSALANFRGDASLSTWIYRIATNTAIDHQRRSSSGPGQLTARGPEDDDTLAGDEAVALEESTPSLDTRLIRKEMNECIRGIVDNLPENYRTVLVLSELEGFTNKEIADIAGLSLETVKIRLYRARTRLRTELEAKCNFYRDDRNELACDRKAGPLNFLKK